MVRRLHEEPRLVERGDRDARVGCRSGGDRLGVGGGEGSRDQCERRERRQARGSADVRLGLQHTRRFSCRRPRRGRGGRAHASAPAPGPTPVRSPAARRAGRRARGARASLRWQRAGAQAGAGRCRGRTRPQPGGRGAAPPPCRSSTRRLVAAVLTDSVEVGAGGSPWPRRAGPRHLADVDAEQRRQLFAQPAHTDAQGLHPQAAAVRAHDGPRLAAARAAQHLLVLRAGDGCATARALRQLPAVGARQQARAAGAVVDAHQRAALGGRRIVEHRAGQPHELLGEQAACAGRRRGGRPRSSAGHPARSSCGGGRPSSRSSGRRHLDRRDGRNQQARRARPAGPFAQHLDRAVGGRALLAVGSDRARRARRRRPAVRHRRPSAATRADDHGPAGSRLRPAARRRHAAPRSGAPRAAPPNRSKGRARRRCRRGSRTRSSAMTDRTRSIRSVAGGRRTIVSRRAVGRALPAHGAAIVGRRRSRRDGSAGRGCEAAHARSRRVTRCGGRRPAVRPTARRPTRPARPRPRAGPSRARTSAGGARRRAAARRARRPPVRPDHPAAHGTPVQRDADPGADAHVVVPSAGTA